MMDCVGLLIGTSAYYVDSGAVSTVHVLDLQIINDYDISISSGTGSVSTADLTHLVGLSASLINTTIQQGVINIYYPELHELYRTFVNASYIYIYIENLYLHSIYLHTSVQFNWHK